MIRSLTHFHSSPNLALDAERAREHQAATPATARDDSAIGEQRLHLQDRLHVLTQQAQRHGGAQPLRQQLHQELDRLWRFERTGRQDWASETPYAQKRRSELSSIPGAEHIAAQYGLSFAKPQQHEPELQRHPRMDNPGDSFYQRDNTAESVTQRMEFLYRQKHGKTHYPLLFVNSPYVAEKILGHLEGSRHIQGGDVEQHLQQHLKPLQPGVYALEMLSDTAKEHAEPLAHIYGATPSSYAVMNGMQGPLKAISYDARINNGTLLSALRGNNDGSSIVARLRAIPEDHGAKAMADTAASLIETFLQTVASTGLTEQDRHNPILANGLKALHAVADSLPSLSHDSNRFSSGYQAMFEELQVCLSALQPYDLDDFRAAASQMMAPAQLPAHVRQPSVHLMSSGMASLALAHDIADTLTGSNRVELLTHPKHGQTPLYFEVKDVRHFNQVEEYQAPTLFATLNHSQPGGLDSHKKGWNVDSIIEAMQERLAQHPQGPHADKPLVLMLDATLEQREDMPRLMHALGGAIGEGKLRVLVAKSYQKYANLGSAKVMAGSLAMVSVPDQAAREAHEEMSEAAGSYNGHQGNDFQLLTHMLKNREQEFDLLEQACANANFVADNFFTGLDGHATIDRHEPQLPFLAFNENEHETFKFSIGLGLSNYSAQLKRSDHMPQELIRGRDSFGFNESTVSYIPLSPDTNEQSARISFGQESQAELTERFFMPSRLMQAKGSQWSVAMARNYFNELLNSQLRSTPLPPQATLTQKIAAVAEQNDPKPPMTVSLSARPAQQRQMHQTAGEFRLGINQLASVLIHLGSLVMSATDSEDADTGADKDTLNQLVDAMIHSGMKGVSSTGRAHIMALRFHLSNGEMSSTRMPLQQKGLESLVSAMMRQPGTPSHAAMLLEIPDDVFTAASTQMQDQITEGLFLALDNLTRLALIKQMMSNGQLDKVDHCLKAMERSLDRQPPLSAQTLQPNLQRKGVLATSGPLEMAHLQSQLARHKVELSESYDMMAQMDGLELDISDEDFSDEDLSEEMEVDSDDMDLT
ncbi:hypothetical protein ACKC9G_09450 [Pokkaliibacter sp. CJK22405]|uniref:hypothetical protein n=1 Tax=Pokkaliibacter sp. CJK22405 TaxID=3384615 RepID=UPI0039856AF9